MKSILPQEILNKIADLTAQILDKKGIDYIREGTVFHTIPLNMNEVFQAQLEANRILLESGDLTMEMLQKDHDANFGK